MLTRLLSKLLFAVVLLCSTAAGQAAPPPAGAVISNTGQGIYIDSTTGLSVRLVSNTVNTIVRVLEALTLTNSQNLLVATGSVFSISHTLTNTGNVASSFLVSVAIGSGGAFTPVNLQVVDDVNANGRIDPGEPVLTPGSVIGLPPGASAMLLVTGQIPAGASPGQQASLMITATSQLQGVSASNTDALNLTNGAAVQVTLAASLPSATPGVPFDLTAIAVNSGAGPAGPTLVNINGAAANLFVLRIPIPANTTFVASQQAVPADAQLLYHLTGSPADSYVVVLAAGSVVDAVGWALTSLPANGRLQGHLTVQSNANAAGSISATAFIDWNEFGANFTTPSNTVLLALPPRAASINFYPPSGYNTPATQSSLGTPLFVQVDAAACNADSLSIGSIVVTLVSQLTGDTESFTATETGPNTGLYRILPNVPTGNASSRVVASGNGVMEVLRNDTISATVTTCGGLSVTATTVLLIDPSGVVYNSRTGLPVASVTVELIDVTGAGNGGSPGTAAVVFEADGVTPAPAVITTGADGSFSFPLVSSSTYRLRVTTPAGFTFASALPPALQPAGRFIDAQGSYGGPFRVDDRPVRLDVPVDPSEASSLFIEKTAKKTIAEIGDFVDYTVRFNNVAAVSLPGVFLKDRLPAGFTYVRGTARFGDVPLPDPVNRNGPNLQFNIGTIAAGGQPKLTYRVRLGVGSAGGTGVNSAQAFSGRLVSNQSSVRVKVVGGVFSSKAYVVGKVFADCSRDGIQNAADPGVPGVRIYLENGTYAVTDEEGKYSLYGLEPRTHVAKLDLTSLPISATLQVLGNRNAMDAGSRFVDLTNGELAKADFAIEGCTLLVREQIDIRRRALSNPSEIAQAAINPLTRDAAAAVDARTLPAAGAIGLPGALRSATGDSNAVHNGGTMSGLPAMPFRDGFTRPPSATGANAPAIGAVGDTGGPYAPYAQGIARPLYVSPASVQKANPARSPEPAEAVIGMEPVLITQPLEDLLPGLTAEVGFIGLSDRQVLNAAQTRVRVKGPSAATFELTVNGQLVSAGQVGKKSNFAKTGVTAWEYIGVNLAAGSNTLSVRALDSFGIARGSSQIVVRAPGQLASMDIMAPADPVADAATPLTITVLLRDAAGLPVAGPMQVTLQASLGQWQTADLDPSQNGTQVFVEGGSGRFMLLPPAQPGRADISASSGTIRSTAVIDFIPNLRPMIAAGIVEGTVNLRSLNPGALQPAQGGDVFERQIQSTSRSFSGGKGDVAARTALFLKGKVLGSSLLTLSYDSDKPADTALFRDIQPNQFYPVYGDAGTRGFDAQSTGRLYVLLQNGTSFALLGDYTTQSDNAARQLSQYSRALNGVKGRWENGALSAEGFASQTSTTQLVQEFRANGTSGPFRLNPSGVINSQQVNLLTRNRNQPSVIMSDVALTSFTDYEIEPFSGLLLLKSPVASIDADLNPVFVRVSYAVDTGGPKHSVAGAEGRLQINPSLSIGASVVQDQDPANKQNLEGVNFSARLGDKTVATGEIARSTTDIQGSGSAARIDIRHDGDALQAKVWGVRTDPGFYNIGSPQSAGQSEYGAKLAYPLDASSRLVGEALRTTNSVTGAEQSGMELRLERSLQGNAKLEVGMRRSSANAYSVLSAFPLPGSTLPVLPSGAGLTANAAQASYTSARVKLTVAVPDVPEAEVFAVAEYAVDGSNGREVGVGGNYALNPSTKLYARHNFVNSLNGLNTLSQAVSQYATVAGITTELSDSTQLFNEYRIGDSLQGRSSEAAVGLRRQLRLDNGLGLTASVQRVKPVSGLAIDDSSAIALGADYTVADDWKASGQLQWQTSVNSRSWLVTAALANKLDEDWTLLNRALYSLQSSQAPGGGERKLITAQAGFAYRPVATNVWSALGRIEYKRDLDSTLGASLNRDESSWVFSAHTNLQPSRSWLVSGRYAARWAQDRSSGIHSSSFTQLLGARSTWDITNSWDAGLQAYRTWGNGTAEDAVGVEVGYLAMKNLWLSLGYNIKGFSARDLTGEAYTRRGLYMRMRFKFDENLFAANDVSSSMSSGPSAPAAVAAPLATAKP